MYFSTVIFGCSNNAGWDWRGLWHVRGRREMHTWVWCGRLKEGNHVEDIGLKKG